VLRAVLDANVFISSAIRPEGPPGAIIERFLRHGAFELVLSQAIVDEVLRALKYPKIRKYLSQAFDTERWFEDIVVLSYFVAGKYGITPVSKDPDDDKYIAAALEGRADFIVAGDSDLLSIKQYQQVRIVSPRAFLDLLSGDAVPL
jgi:putative PIN family toxin of toxin-antitoxin system